MSTNFLKLWCSPKLWQINWPAESNGYGWGMYTVSRTGSSVFNGNGFAVKLDTGTTADSRVNAKILAGGFEGMGLAASDSENWRRIDWTQPIVIGFSFSVSAATTNGSVWLKIGTTAGTSGDLASAGLQIRVDNLSLSFGAHNGSTLDESSSQTLAAAEYQHDIMFVGDGSGSFQCLLDGTLIDTLAGPTAPINFDARFAVEAFNSTDEANASIWCSPLKVGLLT
jgi:hypothetical protein